MSTHPGYDMQFYRGDQRLFRKKFTDPGLDPDVLWRQAVEYLQAELVISPEEAAFFLADRQSQGGVS